MPSQTNFPSARLSRRSLLALAAGAPLALQAQARKVPISLELFSVRKELAADLTGTVKAVAALGYEGVEFFSPYFSWTLDQAKEIRKLLDGLGIKCFSTHNGANAFDTANLQKAIDLNSILGSTMVIMAGAGRVDSIDGWKQVAAKITAASAKFQTAGISAGFHNHQTEFRPLEGQKPIEVLAANTPKEVVLQLDVGTCVETGNDPVAWIRKNPGRLRSIHLKDWSKEPGKGYHVLFGEGSSPWKAIFEAAEAVGGVEHYHIEQEGSDYPPMETVKLCLANYRKLRA
ncbi:MAG TPA: sugar phosphate isomerase/epimerase [Bryobacteraceae bacterium]|nr:xylose isomerase [Bryobacterales bacterium]HRJ20665.1 sugar phosphate isomerase/epimerase [Bryobacteraceae bacterium]